jgi:hypothetical protein
LDPSNLVEQECFPVLVMCRNSEEFSEKRINHYQKDLHFPGSRSYTLVLQSGDDKNNSELDLVLLLHEQENLAVLPRKDTRGDGGFMDQSNAINYQKETSLSRPLESFDKTGAHYAR